MSQNPQSPANELIFINYRREDTAPSARVLEDSLEPHFPNRVFRDIHDIEAGSDWRDVINESIGKSGVVLVLIGREWLTIADKTGKRRLDNPEDLVVAEIAGALKRDKVVIPVLVQGAKMPDEDQLPDALKGLVRRNAINITDEYWDEGVARLVPVLEKFCGKSSQSTATAAIAEPGNAGDATSGKPGVNKGVIIGAAAAALLLVIAVVVYLSKRQSSTPKSQASVAAPANANVAKPPDAAQPERKAVVDLTNNSAEFFFPFDTMRGDWSWYPPDSNSDPADDQYRWEVSGPNECTITVYLAKASSEEKRTGDFKSLLSQTSSETKVRNKSVPDPLEITPTAEPGGLRIKVEGAKLQTMFEHRSAAWVIFEQKMTKNSVSSNKVMVEYK